MNNSDQKGYYINGKKQVIELLQHLEGEERQKLLKNIGIRNASMAKELSEQSFSFKDLFKADHETLSKIMQATTPAIAGLALYLTPRTFQRRALSSMERGRAEQAYNVMSRDLGSKQQECLKAQNKVLQSAIELSRRGIIKLST
ncbi:MAG: FliG C-terminal domain-containing protein [Bacteriovoracaceae bacterium]